MEDSSGQTLVNSDPKVNSMVKLRCSYGGRIRRCRDNPNELCYAGGSSRIVKVEREIKCDELYAKLRSEFNTTEAFTVKYKHPCYDLDTLIVVVDADDVANMMEEYESLEDDQRLRVRLFLFAPGIVLEKKSPDSTDLLSGPEFVFGSDEEIGSNSGAPVVEKEVQTVVEPKCGGYDQCVTKCGGSDKPLAEVEPALDLLQISGMIVPGYSGSSSGSDDSVNDTDNGRTRKNVEGHVNGGACVSVAGKVVRSSGDTSSGPSAYNESDDSGRNGSKPGSGSGDDGKNVALQSECEGQVSGGGGGCVYGVPVTRMSGGQTFYAVPTVVNWESPVYSFVSTTIAVGRVNNQVDEENEANDDQKNG